MKDGKTAFDSCEDGILTEFLRANREEVLHVCMTEFDVQSYTESIREEALEEGFEQGIEIGNKQGFEKGIEKGIEQGIEKGIERGIEKGIEKGSVNSFVTAVQGMIEKLGLDIDQAVTVAGVPPEYVSAVKAML